MKFALVLLSLLTLSAHAVMSDEAYKTAQQAQKAKLIGTWQCHAKYSDERMSADVVATLQFLDDRLISKKTSNISMILPADPIKTEKGTYQVDTTRDWDVFLAAESGGNWVLGEQVASTDKFEVSNPILEKELKLKDYLTMHPFTTTRIDSLDDKTLVLDEGHGVKMNCQKRS